MGKYFILFSSLLLNACAVSQGSRMFDGEVYTLYRSKTALNLSEGTFFYGRKWGPALLIDYRPQEKMLSKDAFFQEEKTKLDKAGCEFQSALHQGQEYYFCEAKNAGAKEYRYMLMILNQMKNGRAYTKIYYMQDKPDQAKRQHLIGQMAAFYP
ncbi:hypothetical protein [Neisseria leonii]|uniref:hypothetical protein n=1 Tax=Neisseria leonii TaxID=2995413 RepID=UPI00237AD449|nr:hypothetical protein [Neisseria sp. 3986]MDD9324818.1 hypothetical protein [Neisseria sp. 3986]